MLYLVFGGFFLVYLLLGWFTSAVEMNSISAVLSVVFIFTNGYMFVKEKKKKENSS